MGPIITMWMSAFEPAKIEISATILDCWYGLAFESSRLQQDKLYSHLPYKQLSYFFWLLILQRVLVALGEDT